MPVNDLFIDRFKSIASIYADQIAIVVDGNEKTTYRELWNYSGQIAAQINDMVKTDAETLVAVCLPKSLDYIATILGVWRAGAAWLPIDPNLPSGRIKFMIEDSNCSLVVGDESFVQLFKKELPRRAFLKSLKSGGNRTLPDNDNTRPDIHPELSELAYVIYTSGSTGQPKGVEVTHQGIVSMLDQQIAALQLTPESRSLFLLSTSFDASVSDIGTSLLSGASLWIENQLFTNGRLSASPKQIVDLICKRQITYVDIPPSILSQIPPDSCPSCLKTILIGGEVCSPDVIRTWSQKIRLLNVYGPTEATVCTSFSLCDSLWNRPLIGKPLKGLVYKIDGQHQGELLIGGTGLARGYRNRPELTAEKFITEDGQSFYRTGDLVRLTGQNEFEFVGRLDQQVKIQGHRIELEEIEILIASHNDVRRAAAIPVKQKYLIAFASLNSPSADVTSVRKDLRKSLSNKLPPYCQPRKICLIQGIPETLTGKIDRKKLSQWIALGSIPEMVSAQESPMAPSLSPRERKLLAIFGQTLGHSDFSVNDNFFDIGGDSLAALEVALLAQQNRVPLSPQLLAEAGSIRNICREIPSQNTFHFDWQMNHQSKMSAQQLRIDIRAILGDRKFSKSKGRRNNASSRSIFLTGATGFLGSRLLDRLLMDESRKITCLIRARDDQSALERLREKLAENRVFLNTGKWQRVTAIAGDISQHDFGLQKYTYDELSQSTDTIVHSAADLNILSSYDKLRSPNVEGVFNVAELAAGGREKTLNYISTLSVLVETDRFQGTMLESDKLDQSKWIYGGYAQSKWAAEALLQMRSDIPIRIFRPGLLTCDMQNMFAPKMDLLTLLIQTISELGFAPECKRDLMVDITPVNFAADAIVKLIDSGIQENTFHIAHPTGLSAVDLLSNLIKLRPNVKLVTPDQFETLIQKTQPEWGIAAACWGLCRALADEQESPTSFDLFKTTNSNFDTSNTTRGLQGTGIEPPELSDKFVQEMIQNVLQQAKEVAPFVKN